MHKIFMFVTFGLITAAIFGAAISNDKSLAFVLAVIAVVLVTMVIWMQSTHDAPMPHTSYHWLLAKIRSWPDEYWQRIGIDKELFEQWMTYGEILWRQGNIVVEGRGETLPDFHYLDKNSGGLGLVMLGVLAEMYDAGSDPSQERAEHIRKMFQSVCPGFGPRMVGPYPKGHAKFSAAMRIQAERFTVS